MGGWRLLKWSRELNKRVAKAKVRNNSRCCRKTLWGVSYFLYNYKVYTNILYTDILYTYCTVYSLY